MNETAIDIDQTDDAALTVEVSDEALEAAASRSRTRADTTYSFLTPFCV